MISRNDSFMLYVELGVELFSIFELLYSNIKNKLRIVRARLNFYMINDNPNANLGNHHRSLQTRRIALKVDYHKETKGQACLSPVEFIHLETLAKSFIIPARQNQSVQENIFNNAPVRRIDIAMKAGSAFTGSYTENPFWNQQFDLRQKNSEVPNQLTILMLDEADNCRVYVTTLEIMIFQDDIPLIPIDNFEDNYVLLSDLTSMQDGTENYHYPELFGEPLRLELDYTSSRTRY